MELTKSELEIMNVFWAAQRSLTRGEILELSVNKQWKDNSIHILLNRLLAKGALAENGFARSGKSYGRLYMPTLSGKEYYSKNVFCGSRDKMIMLFDALISSGSMTTEMIDIFRDKLDAKKSESN